MKISAAKMFAVVSVSTASKKIRKIIAPQNHAVNNAEHDFGWCGSIVKRLGYMQDFKSYY